MMIQRRRTFKLQPCLFSKNNKKHLIITTISILIFNVLVLFDNVNTINAFLIKLSSSSSSSSLSLSSLPLSSLSSPLSRTTKTMTSSILIRNKPTSTTATWGEIKRSSSSDIDTSYNDVHHDNNGKTKTINNDNNNNININNNIDSNNNDDDSITTSIMTMSTRKAFLHTSATITSILALSCTTATPATAKSNASSGSNNMVANAIQQEQKYHEQTNTKTNSNTNTIPSPTSPTSPTSSLTALQETISGLVSGATVTTTKTFIKYPLDTATVRLQMKSTPYTLSNINELFNGSFNGIATPLLSNIPAGALFFAIKDGTKSILKSEKFQEEYGLHNIPKWVSTCIAVGVALPPYWFLRNPSEVIKTRQQIGRNGSTSASATTSNDESPHNNNNNNNNNTPTAWEAIQTIYKSNNNSTIDTVKELYTGYNENILYGYPADIIKFVAYESLTSSSLGNDGKVSPLYGALCGAGATAIAQFCTTPLDVVRNRIMAETKGKQDEYDNKNGDSETSLSSSSSPSSPSPSYIDTLVTLGKQEGLSGLFAGGTPRIGKALLSGAIQFAAYEETKESFRQFFEKR